MKEMTTAEFGKAKLDGLTEPVKIRRYTKAVGTYYPEGYIAALPDAPAHIALETNDTVIGPSARNRIEELEDEVKRLKKELAARPPVVLAAAKYTSVGDSQERRTIPQHPMKDAFAGLAKQDREFFERKLGKPAKEK